MPANEQYLRNLKKTHVAFLASVLAFTFATVVVLFRDHNDEWRGFQRQFLQMEAENLRRDAAGVIQAAGGETEFDAQLSMLTERIREAEMQLQGISQEVGVAKAAAIEAKTKADLKGREVRFARAHRDVARANYDLGIRDVIAEAPLAVLKTEFEAKQQVVTGLEAEWERLTSESKAASFASAQLTSSKDKLEDAKKKYTADVIRIQDSLTEIAPAGGLQALKRAFMEWPIVDGFNGHLEVKQDWLPELRIRLGMATPARFDRCRTCHLGIDRFGAGNVATYPALDVGGKYPQPFSSHPRPDVYITATSPHPIGTFGCTVCHEGQGSATSFHNAQHGANDPHQDHIWNEKYGHFHNHFWEYPMFPERLREASCLKCHHDVVELGVNATYGATAPKAVEGWNLIRQYGCFGCHEINGFDGKRRVGPDLRLEPTEEEEPKYASDPNLVRGNERKVGPSLKHVAQKTNANWIAAWTREPKAFRPNTRMPQFFGLTNLGDAHGQEMSQVEIAGLASFLVRQSTDNDLLRPRQGYVSDKARGKKLFAEKGCLACHSHIDPDFSGVEASFGPELSTVAQKLRAGDDGFAWLYTWIREPERHHPRTKMPNLFLDAYETVEGDKLVLVDPAADIAAYLIGEGPKEYPTAPFERPSLIALAKSQLVGKALTEPQFEEFISTRKLPIPASSLKGDDVELARLESVSDESIFDKTLLDYVGRRSVSRYGCYACHDINGFGTARSIGTGLADWGRKDTGRLALEHIEEFLAHHGETDGSSTHHRVESALAKAKAKAFDSPEEEWQELRAAYFYEDLAHHGRAGFIYQKLRDPRSYDYHKTETKTYGERLVMPKFPFNEAQIEAIATFVLGLVADPPASQYVYRPSQAQKDRNHGEYLLQKFNCTGCHILSLPTFEFTFSEGDLSPSVLEDKEHKLGLAKLLNLRKPSPAFLADQVRSDGTKAKIARIVGMPDLTPDPDEDPADRVYSIETWEPQALATSAELDSVVKAGPIGSQLEFVHDPDTANNKFSHVGIRNGKEEPIRLLLPGSKPVIKEQAITKITPARGGKFAEWLVDRIAKEQRKNKKDAWQMSPPPLHLEGQKIQTPWAYRFLLEPEQIRYTTVLRMPKFNISGSEAAALANYFAAADGIPYPYDSVPAADPTSLDPTESERRVTPALVDEASKYDESWKMLTTTLCIKCHAVGGRPFLTAPGTAGVVRGPNLERVATRLRPEWVDVWLNKPAWITPYTGMPLPFGADSLGDKNEYKHVFGGNPKEQTDGVYRALMNYQRLLEKHGKAAGSQPLVPAPTADKK